MEINLEPGLYIVAVSGGVDSVVLLDLLSKQKKLNLIVAHFDHGIRKSSNLDHDFVKELAYVRKIPFYSERIELGPDVSEETARIARYNFLEKTRKNLAADSIVTAHHQDDLIETATFNIIRGTGRRGLSSLKSTKTIKRPLLLYPKQDLIDYAEKNNLKWLEDETNKDTKYSRNYIRHKLLSGLSRQSKNNFVDILSNSRKINHTLDLELNRQLIKHSSGNTLDKKWFIMLPHKVSTEIMASWLRNQGLGSFDRKTIDRSVIAAKTFDKNKQLDLYNKASLVIGINTLKITK